MADISQSNQPAATESVRYHAIDNLRAGMISVVMFGHALLPYLTVPRRFSDPNTHVAFDVLAVFLYSFAMPVFFVSAGFTAALLYEKKGAAGLARNRFRTIFVPLIAAYILISPLTRGAYIFAKNVSLSGSLQVGLDILQQGDWIRWGKPYHLWFLLALLLYTALAAGLAGGFRGLLHDRLSQVREATRRLYASRWRPVWLTLIMSLALVPAYVLFNGDASTPPMQATLFGFFLVGWLLYLHRDLLPTMRDGAWKLVVVALVVLPAAVWSSRARWFAPEEIQLLEGIVAGFTNATLAAFMTFALLGIFQGRFDRRPSPLGQYVSDASYWIFLIHLPLLIAVAGVLSVTGLAAPVKYLVTVAVVVPLVFATYHLLVRSTRFGGFLKGRNRQQAK